MFSVQMKMYYIEEAQSLLFIEVMLTLLMNARWSQNGVTVDDGNGYGNAVNQLNFPFGLDIDDHNQSIAIADCVDHCIVE